MKKVFIGFIAVCLIFSLSAKDANDDMLEKTKLAEKLVSVMGFKEQVVKSFGVVKKLQKQIVDKIFENAPKTKEAADYKQKLMDISAKSLSWESLKGDFIQAYAQAYSLDELKSLNTFFATSAGKAFLKKNPQIQRKLYPEIQSRLKDSSMKIRMMAHEFMKQQMLKGKTQMPKELLAPKDVPKTTKKNTAGK